MPYLDYTQMGAVAAGGHYRGRFVTGLTTILAAGIPIGSLRWTDSSHVFVLLSCRAYANVNTAFTTGQVVDVEMIVARSFTVADSAGTSALPFVVPSQQMRAAGGGPKMNSSLINDLRFATTVTLTAGTRTLDTWPFAYCMFNTSNALGNSQGQELYSLSENVSHPLVLGQNEGIIFRIGTTQGAVGKVLYSFVMEWAEAPIYNG